MGYGTDGLTFRTLRDGNKRRVAFFHPNETKPWNPAQWLQAIVGELGEYANLRKKIERGDFPTYGMHGKALLRELGDELADVVIYIDLLAESLGINLGEAVMRKWNAKSEERGIPLSIDADDWHWTRKPTDEEVAISNKFNQP